MRPIRSATTLHQSKPLWALCAYFNPCRDQTRFKNFRLFRASCHVPLIVVEHSVTGSFDLKDEDAQILLKVRGGDVMWQKERLLNIALNSLPPECEYVAWLDADVIFNERSWYHQAIQLLQTYPLIQLFHTVTEVDQFDSRLNLTAKPMTNSVRNSLVSMLHNKSLSLDIFRSCGASLVHGYSPGHAWAARRQLLSNGGFYDALILGSGDKAMAAAAYGCFSSLAMALNLNQWQQEHFYLWAQPFFQRVRGQVGYLRLGIFHLSHGDLLDRGYGTRYKYFSVFNFNPKKDLHIAQSGCWGWKETKPELQRYVEEYFWSREKNGLAER